MLNKRQVLYLVFI